MPQPTLAAFQYSTPDRFIVKAGTYTLNQVRSITGSTRAETPTQTVRRIGENKAYRIVGSPEYSSTCEIEFYDEIDMQDWSAVTGATNLNAGDSIDATRTVTITVELYDAAGNLKRKHILNNAYVTEDTSPRVEAETTPATTTISLASNDRWIVQTVSA